MMKSIFFSSILVLSNQIITASAAVDDAKVSNFVFDDETLSRSRDVRQVSGIWMPDCQKNKHKWRPQCKCRYPVNWESDICQGENWWNRTEVVNNIEKVGRIVGGELAPVSAYPWFAWLMNRGGSRWGCGGMLVAPDYVLTAAHCVSPGDASSLAVLIGAVCPNSGNNCGQPSQLINVQTVTNHPGYNSNTVNNDFSLLKLVSSASATPVAMDQGSFVDNYASNKRKLYSIGFGRLYSGGPEATQLRHVELAFVPRDDCNSANAYDGAITNYMMCAADPGQDSCQGDSGGPLWDSENNVLVGVVSWGYGCALPQYPGVYAQVSTRWDWIKSNICSGHSNPKPSFCSSTPTPPTPPTAPTPTPPTPTPPTGCSSGELAVEVSVITDSYPTEISWTIQGSDGSSQSSEPFDTALETYSKSLCLDSSVCQTFTISDSYGDGILYNDGGALTLIVDNTQVVSDPVYTSSYQYTFGDCNAPTPPTPTAPTPTAPTPTAPTPTPPTSCTELAVDITFVTDGYPIENSWTIESSNGENVYSEQFTDTFTSYEKSLCLDSSLCHKFIVEDTYGDGLLAGGSFSLKVDGTEYYSSPGDGVPFSTLQTEFGNCVVAPTPTAPTPTAPTPTAPTPTAPTPTAPTPTAPTPTAPTPTAPTPTAPTPTAPTPTQCTANELDVAISVTTDSYPDEVSWSIGNQYQGGPFELPYTTYESKLCLNPAFCHTFVISDSYGDGLIPGDGGDFSLKVNGDVKLTLGNGFSNTMETKFGQCDETNPCAVANKKRFKLELTTDKFGSETSFKVMRRRANGKFNKKVFAGNNFGDETKYIRSKCLNKNKCYKLVVYDSQGDGICCEFGEGKFQGYWKGVAVTNQDDVFDSGSVARSEAFGKCV